MTRSRLILITAFLAATFGAFPAAAQNISIVRGNGQLICLGCLNGSSGVFQPMIGRVTDNNGTPLPNVVVNWSSTSGTLQPQSVTNAEGLTQNVVFAQFLPNSNILQDFLSYTITASTSTSSVNFYATVATPGAQSLGIDPIRVFATNVPVGGLVTGQVGASGDPIELRVFDDKGNAVPNVALFLVNNQLATDGPIVTCTTQPGAGENTVLTDATGTARCTPVFGGKPNVVGQFSVLVGGAYPGGDATQTPRGYWNSLPSSVTVTPGVPGSIKIISGSGQSVNPGRSLTAPLVVEVDSLTDSPLGGQEVRWTITPANAGTFGAVTTTTDASGRASNTLTIASTAAAGAVTITATSVSDPSKSVTFAATIVPVITITGFQIFSGNSQSASINTPFALPLIVQVTTNGSAANIPVQFSATGPVTLSATTATTDASGRAQITATAGSITGVASVTATVASATGIGTQTFNLSIVPPAPVLTASAFVNGADNQVNSLSPCSIAGVVAPAGTFPAQIGTPFFGQPLTTVTRIAVAGIGAPVLSVASTADNRQLLLFQIPCDATPGASVPVTVNAGGSTSTVNLNIQAASPGIFQTLMSDGVQRALLIRPNGSYVSLTNPAVRGENLVAMVTGLGTTTSSIGTGSVAAQGSTTTLTGSLVVGMAGQGVPLVSVKRSEDIPGVFLVAFQVPNEISTGNNVTFSIGVTPSGSSTTVYSGTSRIPVQ